MLASVASVYGCEPPSDARPSRQADTALGGKPLLLLFKTNDCLRHTERRLDAGVNSFLITLRFCLGALAAHGRTALERWRLAAAAWVLRVCGQRALHGTPDPKRCSKSI